MQFDLPEMLGVLIVVFIIAYVAYRFGQKSKKANSFTVNNELQQREFQKDITKNVIEDIFTTEITSPNQAIVHLEAVKEVMAKEYEKEMARLDRLYIAEERGVPTPIESEHGIDYIYIKLDKDSKVRVTSEIELTQDSLDHNRMISEALSHVINLLQQVVIENQQETSPELARQQS